MVNWRAAGRWEKGRKPSSKTRSSKKRPAPAARPNGLEDEIEDGLLTGSQDPEKATDGKQ